jgi:hypothetical protein
MTYYCTECEKHHSDKFYKHLKYKKEVKISAGLGDSKSPYEILLERVTKLENDHEEVIKAKIAYDDEQIFFGVHDKEIVEIKKTLDTVIGILIHWKGFIDRKHPYTHTYQPLFDDL